MHNGVLLRVNFVFRGSSGPIIKLRMFHCLESSSKNNVCSADKAKLAKTPFEIHPRCQETKLTGSQSVYFRHVLTVLYVCYCVIFVWKFEIL